MDLADVVRVFDALERAGVRYAVFGGLAMAAHGFDRATRDLGLFVAPDERNIELLRNALTSVYHDPDIEAITAETLYRMKRDTVRLRDRDDAQRLAHAFGFDRQGER